MSERKGYADIRKKHMKKKLSVYHICMIAFAVIINLIGVQLALIFRLPIYLDNIGTVFIAAVYGPFFGMLPPLLSSLLLGMSIDPFSLYYAPASIAFGMLIGFVWRRRKEAFWWPFLAAFLSAVPSSFISASITANLFAGVTSSGSTVLIQLLAKTGLSMTASCFLVQVVSEYADRLLAIFLIIALLKKLPKRFMQKL